MRIIFSLLLALPLIANEAELKNRGYALLDRICVEVEGEAPILESEIKKRAKSKDLSFFVAQDELIYERLLWVLAKKQLKFSVPEIENSALSHAERVIKDNKLTKEQFSKILLQPPYQMSFHQYLRETAYSILRNQVESSIQVVITDGEVAEHVMKMTKSADQPYDVVFISVLPDKTSNNEINHQMKKAKEISSEITATNSLDKLKTKYKDEKKLRFTGPITYQKGALKSLYEQQLAKNNGLITEPFLDDGALVIIWKIKKPEQKLDENALEKVRKELYEAKVIKNFTAALEAVKGISTITSKGCGK